MQVKILNHPKNFGISLLITLLLAIYGGILGIGGMEEWYPSLIKPIDIPMWLFGIVQPLYYIICIAILYRLFSYVENIKNKKRSLFIFIFMMFFAESWNYTFLGLESVTLGFWILVVFSIIVVIAYINLQKTDKVSSFILLPYILWLTVDLAWAYGLWQANS